MHILIGGCREHVFAVSCLPWFASPGSSLPQQASAMQQPQCLPALVKFQQPSQGMFQQQHVLVWCRSFTLQVHSLRKPRTVRQVHIYHCAHPLAELSELKTRPDLWHKVTPYNCSSEVCVQYLYSVCVLSVAMSVVALTGSLLRQQMLCSGKRCCAWRSASRPCGCHRPAST